MKARGRAVAMAHGDIDILAGAPALQQAVGTGRDTVQGIHHDLQIVAPGRRDHQAFRLGSKNFTPSSATNPFT